MNEVERAMAPGSVEQACKQSRAPIDLDHLHRQTMGDSALGREVLDLFIEQSLSVRDQLAGAAPRQRVLLAHGLKGAARGVGAFAIAECADAIERNPDDPDHVERLASLVEDVRAFVAALNG
ncbi:histidine kinase [Mesorhizobium sp. Root157]|uniref:Hpt domain-containing protein n=1 Tax=Mesorhizobium sp. Root157 TaxID=1736477 RepID=UPI0006FC7B2A|nr:Hpt domain-containing protein [Mesorhizobium sp. Root157]KQZ82010.1 histidine kinase [Mesorhizobium sp. Root157]